LRRVYLKRLSASESECQDVFLAFSPARRPRRQSKDKGTEREKNAVIHPGLLREPGAFTWLVQPCLASTLLGAAQSINAMPVSSGGMVTNPSNHCLSVSVRWKHRIDAVQNASLPDDERETLEQTHALHLEPRQLETRRELAGRVTQQLERQVQPAHRLALIVRGLGAQAVNDRAKLLQVPMMVAIGARLRGATAGARYRVPTRRAAQGNASGRPVRG